ncbi:hypothetical protein BpHYR1_049711 [Brachionus plicatilis]|uniref:Uncharacterized protein n=1 Tax=Brachionus plicatilis TaxID=10195 RepID=A0A3M7RPX8_BRAPC|nr:hypothetical protein BpHYR1_049711 [Brachionus plicatilis]
MVYDFLVAHCSCPFFYLNEDEWEKAIEKYPSLLESHGIKYEERTCTGSVVPGQDGYFDNKSILNQFERLFQMLEFKKEFNFPIKHELSSCRHCPYDELKWVDDQLNEFSLSCFFQDGPLKGESKGLRQKALKLGYELDPKIRLKELKNIFIFIAALKAKKNLILF